MTGDQLRAALSSEAHNVDTDVLTLEQIREREHLVITEELPFDQRRSFLYGLCRSAAPQAEGAISNVVQHLTSDELAALIAERLFPGDPQGTHYALSWHGLKAAALNSGWLHASEEVGPGKHRVVFQSEHNRITGTGTELEHRKALLLFILREERIRLVGGG
jgi:hypothetical protein